MHFLQEMALFLHRRTSLGRVYFKFLGQVMSHSAGASRPVPETALLKFYWSESRAQAVHSGLVIRRRYVVGWAQGHVVLLTWGLCKQHARPYAAVQLKYHNRNSNNWERRQGVSPPAEATLVFNFSVEAQCLVSELQGIRSKPETFSCFHYINIASFSHNCHK